MEWLVLDGLSREAKSQVLKSIRRRRFGPKEVVFHEGDPADTLHLIAKGHVAVRSGTPLGDSATLSILGPGDAFGELALVAGPAVRSATVSALEAAETLVLHRDTFVELRKASAEVDSLLVQALALQVRRLSAQLVEALYTPVEIRVVRRLIDLAKLYRGSGEVTVLPLTQDDIAGLAGATRPTVNRVLKELEKARAIGLKRGQIGILDLALLQKRAG